MRGSAVGLLLCLAACTSGSPNEQPKLATEPTLHVAESALKEHNPQLAYKMASAILKHQPHNVNALVVEGDAYFAMKDMAAASRDYQTALKIDPTSVGAQNGMGRLRLSSDPAQAEAMFRKALDSDPRDPTALNDLGIACDMQGRHADAQANYRRALALDPNNSATLVNLGLSLAMSGDKAGALEVLQPLAENPDVAGHMRQNLATALNAAGDPDGAARVSAVDAQSISQGAAD